jgi:hypothetical protein
MPRPAADNIDVATTVFVSKNPSGICKALSLLATSADYDIKSCIITAEDAKVAKKFL